MPDIITVNDLVVVYPERDPGRSTASPSGSPRASSSGSPGRTGPGRAPRSRRSPRSFGRRPDRPPSPATTWTTPREICRSIGVMNQETSLDVDLTGRENLHLQGRLQQLHGPLLEERVDALLKMVELQEVAGKLAGRYSGGMKKRLELALALVHEPKLLFLDEPTTGLAPAVPGGDLGAPGEAEHGERHDDLPDHPGTSRRRTASAGSCASSTTASSSRAAPPRTSRRPSAATRSR